MKKLNLQNQNKLFLMKVFSSRFRVPRGVAMFITSIQLIQMVVGCVVNYIAHVMKQDGLECHVSDRNIKVPSIRYAFGTRLNGP